MDDQELGNRASSQLPVSYNKTRQTKRIKLRLNSQSQRQLYGLLRVLQIILQILLNPMGLFFFICLFRCCLCFCYCYRLCPSLLKTASLAYSTALTIVCFDGTSTLSLHNRKMCTCLLANITITFLAQRRQTRFVVTVVKRTKALSPPKVQISFLIDNILIRPVCL